MYLYSVKQKRVNSDFLDHTFNLCLIYATDLASARLLWKTHQPSLTYPCVRNYGYFDIFDFVQKTR